MIVYNLSMKYLLYIRSGFIKKFPLEKETITLGRDPQCDIFIDEAFISKNHAAISLTGNAIEVEDMGSKNGIFVNGARTGKALLKLDESFQIGVMEFFLKEGNAGEFEISEDARNLLERTVKLTSVITNDTKTSLNLFDKALVTTLQMGFRVSRFENVLEKVKISLVNTLQTGSLMVVSLDDEKAKIISQLHLERYMGVDFQKLYLEHNADLFNTEWSDMRVGRKTRCYSFPIRLLEAPAALFYVYSPANPVPEKAVDFLRDLAKEISIIYALVEHNKMPDQHQDGHSLNTQNQPLIRTFEKCKKMAKSDLFILIEGETGVGKEVLAKFIHHHSGLKPDGYIGINCSAIPETLLEAELFGHEKGAFTGASSMRKGKLELASGGTLVLDEIGYMPLNLQAKLLRVLQEKELYRIGGSEPIQVDFRLISLTNRDLKGQVAQNQFREDLYYRIAHFKVKLPALRERKEDIVPLLNHFLDIFSKKYSVQIKGVSQEALAAIQGYNWPGNVRELENEVRSLVNQADDGEVIDLHMLKEEILSGGEKPEPKPEFESKAGIGDEKRDLIALLERHRWNKSRVAEALQVSRMTLYKRMKKYGIDG